MQRLCIQHCSCVLCNKQNTVQVGRSQTTPPNLDAREEGQKYQECWRTFQCYCTLQLLDRKALTWTQAMDVHVLNSAARRLGYESLQAAVVHAFVEGNDVFAALPTGYGKGLCVAVLPYIFDSQ